MNIIVDFKLDTKSKHHQSEFISVLKLNNVFNVYNDDLVASPFNLRYAKIKSVHNLKDNLAFYMDSIEDKIKLFSSKNVVNFFIT